MRGTGGSNRTIYDQGDGNTRRDENNAMQDEEERDSRRTRESWRETGDAWSAGLIPVQWASVLIRSPEGPERRPAIR